MTICTGNVSGSGTDASVFLNIIGDLGDTGERLMIMSKNNVNKFEKGNVSAERRKQKIQKFDKILCKNCVYVPISTMSFSLSPCPWVGCTGCGSAMMAEVEAVAGSWIK